MKDIPLQNIPIRSALGRQIRAGEGDLEPVFKFWDNTNLRVELFQWRGLFGTPRKIRVGP